jgi:hypothetical protein
VLFWFVILAMSYAGERSSFKLLVDKAGPFRLFAVEMVTGTHALILGLILLIGYFVGHTQQIKRLGVPIIDVGLMALLDTVTLLLVFLTGWGVPPTLTVILVQFILPLTAFLTQFVHPDGYFSCNRPTPIVVENGPTVRDGSMLPPPPPPEQDGPPYYDIYRMVVLTRTEEAPMPGFGGLSRGHVWGSLIIFLAGLLALSPACYAIADPQFFYYADAIPIRTAISSMLYASSCIPAAASQLYKEHIFLRYKQPVNMDYLNLLLSLFQFAFSTIVSPLLYGLLGMGAKGDWTLLYPSSDYSENYLDGLKCFFCLLSKDDQENKYPDDADCSYSLGLVLIHALSIIMVGVAVDKIVNAGATKVMYRGISAGIILSVLCMHVYDMVTPDFNYGPVVDALNLFCLVLLVLGSEVYHRVSLQDSTFETEYVQVEPFYQLE